MLKRRIVYILLFALALMKVTAQEESPFVVYDVPSQNLLKYNRFLINPTFSTVREDKSYINLLHRNQSVQFDDNNQNYFLSYSGRISDRTGLGLSLYTQRAGTVSNYGVLANYAYGIKLSDKSNFTFGANLSYYNSGFDQNRANTVDPNDPLLNGLQDSNLLSFQPGFNLSYGKFDFGVFAENLFDYNLKTSNSITEFKDKTFSGHLQYTHQFENASGIFEDGRLMPLARARKVGVSDIVLGGSLILDLPKVGWLQGGYDSFYGAAAGIGFNLNQRISLGYTMEKGLSSNFENFGMTHEISFAYSFTPNLTEDRVMLEDEGDDLAANEILENVNPSSNAEVEDLKTKLAENDAILAELMFRQDSLEANRQKDLERRFEMVMRMVRNETKGNRPDIEKKAAELFLGKDDTVAIAVNNAAQDGRVVENGQPKTKNPKNTEAISTKETVQPKKISQAVAQKEITRSITNNRDALAIQDKKPSGIATQTKNLDQTSPIKTKVYRNLEGVQDGYYVVANVYKGGNYLTKFIDKLGQQGITADYIDNPENGLKYVYVQRFDTWQEAEAAHNSKLNGTYTGDLWIMNVDNRYSNERYADNVNKIKEKSAKYNTDVLQKNVVVKDRVASNEAQEKSFNIDGIGSGYYIIANVFANPNNARRFIKLLNSYGLSASYFINPENNWRYVYLKRHESWNNALISYYSKLNDSYDDTMWIMRVTPNKIA
ncbi:MAG: type IX secretion system membrane protein PorP/SprF [Maribacter sp.]|nr:type IX secretion system membrane protein PorP/SprF [Maribacter sp.]